MNKLILVVSGIALLIAMTALAIALKINNRLDTLSSKIEQQSMLINRALGKVIPLVLPADLQEAIASIEKQLDDEKQWPSTVEEVQKLNTKLADLVNNLPPWVQEELLPRLVSRRWEIDTLWFLANSKQAGQDNKLLDHAKAAESLLSQKPSSASEPLRAKLAERHKQIEEEIAQDEQKTAISAAEKAIKEDGDLVFATKLIATCRENDQTKKLAKQLIDAQTRRVFSKELDAIQSLLDSAKNAEYLTQEYTYERVEQMILDVRMRMMSLALSDNKLLDRLNGMQKKISTTLSGLANTRQKRDENKLKEYQKWALSQIKQVREYDAVANSYKKDIKSKIPITNSGKDANRLTSETVRSELIRFMAPIHQGLLDEAVAQLFRKIYQSRFDKLNKDDQLAVVEGFVTTPKQPLREMP